MKKGISLATLAIIIIIMIILAGVTLISALDSFSITEINIFAVEILNIQTKVSDYYYRNNSYPIGESVTVNMSQIAIDAQAQFNEELKSEDNITFKVIDRSLIGIKETEYGNSDYENDVYVVSESTGKVYYLAGVKYEGKTYYTLVDELYDIVNITGVENKDVLTSTDIKVYDVIFTPSETSYTNNPVTVEVKLPLKATDITITTTNDKSVEVQNNSNNYFVYKINETSADKTGNYDVTVTYTLDAAQKTSVYSVSNFDNTKPNVVVDELRNGNVKTINVITKDEESGIAKIKYIDDIVKNEEYFNQYGNTVIGNKFELDVDKEYTICVQDSAGNKTLINTEKYAIYSSTDNSLTFTATAENIEKDKEYNGKVVTQYYTGVEQIAVSEITSIPWYEYRNKITSVVVENYFSPINTAYWFMEFNNCSTMNLTKLNMSNVTHTEYMFRQAGYAAEEFILTGLESWDVSNVLDSGGMFRQSGYNSKKYDIGNLDNWNMKNNTDMGTMFQEAGVAATEWNIGDLSKWNTSKVKSMGYMFHVAGKNANTFDLGNLNTKQVTASDGSKYYAWDVSNVEKMGGMFGGTAKYSQKVNIGILDGWNTQNVDDMQYMFSYFGANCSSWTIGDISKWNTSKVKYMQYMFNGLGELASSFDLGNLNTKQVTASDGSKYYAWDVSNVEDFSGMFKHAGRCAKEKFTIGSISNWNTSKALNMKEMFYRAAEQSAIFTIGDLTSKKVIKEDQSEYIAWNTSNVTDMTGMFHLTGYYADWYLDLSQWDVSSVVYSENFNYKVTSKVVSPQFN